MKRFWEVKNQTADRAEIWIYEEIGENFWGEGIAAKQFVKDLAALDVANIDLRINSPGGSVWDGQAIYNAVKRHPANVTTYIDGLAASIASVIALAGDTVIMAENALMMIHKAWALAIGNADEMRDFADVLDKIDETLVGVYVRKTGRDEGQITDALAAETWFTASEAAEWGLVDQVEPGLAAAALIIPSELKARYKNVPDSVTTTSPKAQPMPMSPSPSMSPSPMMDDSDGTSDSGGGTSHSSVHDFDLERIKLRR